MASVVGSPSIDGVELLEVIGRGASSVVYRGRQVRFDRPVAVKVLDLAGQPELVAQLYLNECRTVGRLASHPNIVTVHDGGLCEDERPYLIMEYLGGGTLGDLVADGNPLPVERVLRHGVELAGSLESAHRNGIVHGDVKPQNILLGRSGQAVLSDFGIARIAAGTTSRSLSVFTPLHAAPEMFDGERVTPQADVYGLGSTLFQLLDGRSAVGEPDESPLVIVRRVALDERRSLGRPDLPDGLAELVTAMMATAPADRPDTAADVGERLRGIQSDLGVTPTGMVVFDEVAEVPDRPPIRVASPATEPANQTIPPVDPRRPGVARLVTTVAVLASLALLIGIGWALVRSSSEPSGEVTAEEEAAAAAAPPSTDAPAGRIPTGAAGLSTATTVDPSQQEEVPTRDTSGSGPLAGMSYDVPGYYDTSSVLLAQLGDGSEVLGPFSPELSVVNVAIPVVPKIPARGAWRSFNLIDNPECPGFDSPPFVLTGMWDKLATWPGGQGGVRVLQLGDADGARWLFNAFSLEQGAGPGECVGFDESFGISEPDTARVTHRDPPLDLGDGVVANSWLQPPPPGSPEFTSVRTFLVQDGAFVVSGAVGAREGTPDVAAIERVLTGVLDRLR